MTHRYFYTDPLAAAWMARHFGMMFGIKHNGKVHWNCIGTLYEPLEPLKTPEDILDPISANTTLYVHPDSQHLLQPCIGDILRLYFYSPKEDDNNGAVMTGFYAGAREAITWFRDPKDGGIEKQLHKIDDHQWRVIQRNGLPFHFPESEPTNG